MPSLRRGDVYFVDLEPTRGHEQRGRRPVLIVSPARLNDYTQTPVVLPITNGGAFARTAGYAVPLQGKTTGFVRCDQPRAIDLSTRERRFVESLEESVVAEVLAKMLTLFS